MILGYKLEDKRPVPCASEEEFHDQFRANRAVAKTQVGPSHVSTVFLVVDHSFESGRTPVLFETMVFGGLLDQEQERYCTYEQAEAGHLAMVDRCKMHEPKTR